MIKYDRLNMPRLRSSPALLVILVMILTENVSVSRAERCTNYVNGVKDTRECSFGCCLTGGSFAIDLTESEVCHNDKGVCGDPKPAIPTSCPIRVNKKFEMFGCGVYEKCCYPLEDPAPEFEYQVPADHVVCSVDGKCIDQGSKDFDSWGLDDLKDSHDGYLSDVYCYDNCMDVIESTFSSDLVDFDIVSSLSSCSRETVRFCSAALEEACLFFDFKSKADLIIPTQQGFITQPGEVKIRVPYCGSLEDTAKPDSKCTNAKEKFHGVNDEINQSGDEVEFKNIVSECGKVDRCEGDCIKEEHKPRKEGLEWWAILLIVILIIILIAAVVLLYCMFCKKDAVHPKDEEAPMYLEHIEDPRAERLKEVERYLDDAMAFKDMADLKLTIDIVEEEGFQDDLREKYDRAVQMLEDLMAREAETKRKELQEEERKAEEAKRALEEAEKEVERRRKEEEKEALRRAIEARDEAKARWARQWPRLHILRALNGINEDLAAKAMEEAKKAREEAERKRRFEEDQAKKVAYCKQLLKKSVASSDEEKLENAIKTTDLTTFQTSIMDTDEELRDLHDKAKSELERLRLEREQQEREAEEKRKEEARLAEEKRKEEERIAEEKRKEEERLKEEKRLAALAKLAEIEAALQTAISEKDIAKLKKSIADVEKNNLVEDLADLHKQATALLERLQKIEKIKKNIQELKRPLIAELKSMANPPVDVQRSMTAAFLLMGENLKDLKDWNNIVILLNKTGRDSVKRRVQELKVQDVTEEMASSAGEQILGLTSDEVYEANQAASLFFDWAEMICYERKHSD